MTGVMKSLRVSNGGIEVTFSSADDNELAAVRNCFDYVWTVEAPFNVAAGWTVVSQEVSSLRDIADVAAFEVTAGLYKQQDLKASSEGGCRRYFHHLRDIACLTSFDLTRRAVQFHHEGRIDAYGYSYIRNLVREPMAAQYERTGHVMMHAAACAIEGRGLMMPGLKGAGKSTLLGHLLGQGASYVGNDAVLSRREADCVVLTAFPQCVRMSQQTVENDPMLSRFFSLPRDYAVVNDKLEFLPRLFDDMRPTHRPALTVPLELILLPSIDLGRSGYALEPTDRIAPAILEASLFYPCHNYVWSPLFEDLNGRAVARPNVAEIFEAVPKVFQLKYGVLDAGARAQMFRDVAEIVTGERSSPKM